MLNRKRFKRTPILLLIVLFLLPMAAEATVYMVRVVNLELTQVIPFAGMVEVANQYDPSQYVDLTSGFSVDAVINQPPGTLVLLTEEQLQELQQALSAPLTANAGGPYSGVQGTPVSVTAAGSGGIIANYAWDLDNDGQYDDATGVNATFSSIVTGTYTVVVRVLDNNGDPATDAATVTVHPFLITSCSSSSGQPFSLSWQSHTGNVYTIVYTSDLTDSWQSAVGHEDVAGTGGLMSFTNELTVDNAMFYQVRTSTP